MIRAQSLLALLSALGATAAATACTSQSRATTHPPPGYFDAHAAPAYAPAASTSRGVAAAPCAPPPAAAPCAPPPCAPPPCAPPPCAPPPCGLPCELGQSDWHVRVLGGFPFQFGTDPGEGCNYWGVDVGTTRCNCVGFDLFYRGMHCGDDKVSSGPGNSPTARVIPVHFDRDSFGKDGGAFQFVGVKATYQKSLGTGRLYGYVGAGPEYFWTQDYLDDDSGFGGFAEAGIGWRFASWGSVRLGLDLHGDYTSVTRKDPANSGDSRMLWTLAPNIGVEFDF